MREIKINFSEKAAAYRISLGNGQLSLAGNWATTTFGRADCRVLVISNPTVNDVYGETLVSSLTAAGFRVSVWLMKDGEEHKSLASVTKALKAMSSAGLERTDAVVAFGGGVVGDLAGFAASVYLRGVKFLQIPTTLLAMVDSSVGGKTGVNAAFGKNMIGAFHQPSGVLVDTNVLATLPERELTAGLCEMVKHAVISGGMLFERTSEFLNERDGRPAISNFEFDISKTKDQRPKTKVQSSKIKDLEKLIASNISFKARIVAGDEFESTSRVDSRSRKILNFGHTLAHALEKVTNYSHFRHGEAVGWGILYAAEMSKSLDLLDKKSVNLLYDVVHSVGALPTLADIDFEDVFDAFRFDKKRNDGTLQMVLLKGIGKPAIIEIADTSRSLHLNAYKRIKSR